ncbi:MAG: CRISPR-associated protein Cas4 [Candidatus Korarchaeum sp.]
MRSTRKRSSCSEEDLIPVSELRQYHFCPMVVYFHAIGIEEAEKEYMRMGRESQRSFTSKEGRRATLGGLRKLRVDERIANMRLSSLKLCVQGVADLVVRMGEEWAVAELKGGRMPRYVSLGHRVQVAAYSMLLEERIGKLVRRAFIIYDDGLHEVPMSENVRRHVLWTLERVREIYDGKVPTSKHGKCEACGYSAYCLG